MKFQPAEIKEEKKKKKIGSGGEELVFVIVQLLNLLFDCPSQINGASIIAHFFSELCSKQS